MYVPAVRSVQFLAVCLLLCGACPGAYAVQSLEFRLGAVSGDGWSASGVELVVEWLDSSTFRTTLRAERVQFPAPLGQLDGVTVQCPQTLFDGAELVCRQGGLQAVSGRLGPQQAGLSFRYRPGDRKLHLELRSLHYLAGRLSLQADYAQQGWAVQLQGEQLALQSLLQELRAIDYPVPAIDGEGSITVSATLQGTAGVIRSLRLAAELESPAFSDAAGVLAGENLGLQLVLQASAVAQGWRGKLDGSLRNGALYVEPLYIEAGAVPLTLQAQLDWQPQRQQLAFEEFEFQQPDVLALRGRGSLDFSGKPVLEQLQATLEQCRLPACYGTWLQPWLHGTVGGQLDTEGSIAASIELQSGRPDSLLLNLHQVKVHDEGGRFGFDGLSGRLDWSAHGAPRQSDVHWESGHVYRLALGQTTLVLESQAERVSLQSPASIPVLDGELQLDSLQLEQPEAGDTSWSVDGILTPVSMSALTSALGWPAFGGKLSGLIPSVRYENGELTVGGVLLVRVFDGEVTLRDVRLSDPLGPVPRLQLGAQVHNIDLEALTRTFSFGRIEGRLDGHVDDLVMESWLPVAFDAGFATPPGDRSRHRISQKAVDSISSIGGGGVSGAVSRGLLGFLEDFPYDRLGLSCRLANGVCEMSGIEPTDGGYYIVKGRWLPPRLDVIGHADRVDWDRMVAQVIAVTRGQPAVVK